MKTIFINLQEKKITTPGVKGSKKMEIDLQNQEIRIGGTKNTVHISEFYGSLPTKGDVRKIRKAFRLAGLAGLAGAQRRVA